MAVKGFQLVKTLIIAYVITAVLLLLTAFGLYRLHLSDWQVMAAVVIIYALSCFAGGYILAKAQKSRRMLWGMGFRRSRRFSPSTSPTTRHVSTRKYG